MTNKNFCPFDNRNLDRIYEGRVDTDTTSDTESDRWSFMFDFWTWGPHGEVEAYQWLFVRSVYFSWTETIFEWIILTYVTIFMWYVYFSCVFSSFQPAQMQSHTDHIYTVFPQCVFEYVLAIFLLYTSVRYTFFCENFYFVYPYTGFVCAYV